MLLNKMKIHKAIGLAIAFAMSFAHFLIVVTPNNTMVYFLSSYPGTNEKMIHPIDFLKYGLILWILYIIFIDG